MLIQHSNSSNREHISKILLVRETPGALTINNNHNNNNKLIEIKVTSKISTDRLTKIQTDNKKGQVDTHITEIKTEKNIINTMGATLAIFSKSFSGSNRRNLKNNKNSMQSNNNRLERGTGMRTFGGTRPRDRRSIRKSSKRGIISMKNDLMILTIKLHLKNGKKNLLEIQ
jgi:hypothetical protein